MALPYIHAHRLSIAPAQGVLWWQSIVARLAPHRSPLALVGIAIAIGQFLTLYHRHGMVDTFYDSGNYLAAAQHMVTGAAFFDPLRTPLYPAFLAFFLALPLPHHLGLLVLTQTVMLALATIATYVLAYQLIGSRWLAAGIAVVLGTNLYVLQWERSINSEVVTYCVLIALFLIFERYMRTQRPLYLIWLTVAMLIVIFLRPFFLFLAPLLLGVILFHAARVGQHRRVIRGVSLSFAVIVAIILT